MNKVFTTTMIMLLTLCLYAQSELALKTEEVATTHTSEIANNDSNIEKDDNLPVFIFESYETNEDENVITEDLSHYFGKIAAIKKYKMQHIYTYQTTIGPGNPGMKTVIRKPIIYNAVNKIDRYYRKQVKKGYMNQENAAKAYIKALDVALAAFPIDTEKFEDELNSIKDIESIAKIFNKAVVNIN